MKKEDEFVKVVKQNEGPIYKITRAYTANSEDQKDLYQEIVYQLWKSFDSFKAESNISTWIYRVALNTSITHSKREKKKGVQVTIDFDINDSFDESSALMQERVNLLYAQIRLLNAVDKGILLLFFEGKSHEEIAAITGFSTTNVGTRISRIKNKLKNQIINS